MTDAEVAYHYRSKPAEWLRRFGMILDKTRTLSGFEPNVLQIRVIEHYTDCLMRQAPCRMVVVKPVQEGGSTICAGLLAHHVKNQPTRAGCIGTEYKVSSNIFTMLTTFDDNDAFDWGCVATTKNQDLRKWSNNSLVQLYTADNPEAARSATLQAYHASEVGRWSSEGATDASETLQSMRTRVPKEGFTLILEESTPRGAYGAFYETVQSAKWPEHATWWKKWEPDKPQNIDRLAGDAQFVLIFAGWYEFPKNTVQDLPSDLAAVLMATLDDTEKALIQRFGVTVNQLAWRRRTIKNECKGNVDKFDADYPSDPQSCFAASGAPVFDKLGVARLAAMAAPVTPQVGNLIKNGEDVIFEPDPDGWVYIFEERAEGRRYIIGADPASGASQTDSDDADCHAAPVLREGYISVAHNTQIVVNTSLAARLRPECRDIPDTWGHKLEMLSRYYGIALVAPEMNNTGGGATIEQLRKRRIPFFCRRKISLTTGKESIFEGWMTDDRTRRDIIGNLAKAIRDGEIDIADIHTVNQLKTFVRKRNGREEHADGAHDDDVFGLAIALKCLPSGTVYSRKREIDRRLAQVRERDAAYFERSTGLGGTF